MLGQFCPGTVEPRFDGSNRPVDRLSNLFVRQILFVKQGENHPVFGSKQSQSPLEFSREVIGVDQAWSVVDPILGRLSQSGPSGTVAQRGSAPVRRDPKQPRTNRPFSVEAGDSPKRPDECFLHHVLGVVPMAHHAKAEAKNHPLEPFDHEARSLQIAGAECLDQRTVIHQPHAFARVAGDHTHTFNRGYLNMGSPVSEFVDDRPLLFCGQTRSLLKHSVFGFAGGVREVSVPHERRLG